MIERGGGGRIVNITSITAIHPSRDGLAHYAASKHALWGLTKSAARELAPHGIAVNALAPGGVSTEGRDDELPERLKRIVLRRRATTEEVANAALFLVSGLATYMSGSQLLMDGGFLLS
jgi:2-deoxy-D-gluconate 3-dehydrogenase